MLLQFADYKSQLASFISRTISISQLKKADKTEIHCIPYLSYNVSAYERRSVMAVLRTSVFVFVHLFLSNKIIQPYSLLPLVKLIC